MIAGREERKHYEAALGLAWMSQSGCHSLLKLLTREGALGVWQASVETLNGWGILPRVISNFLARRQAFRVEEAEAAIAGSNLRFVPFRSPGYPKELEDLELPPAGLFVRGSEEPLARLSAMPRVAIVGTRRATVYGKRVTEVFSGAFATSGVVVVSGMALGIDSTAHDAAMQAGGITVAVLGCGADVIYPPRNRWLYDRITAGGLVVSEMPPGARPARWTFPHRNRILAALGDAVVVTEAPRASGALQTVSWALSLGRPVFSVPGPVLSDNHRGCNTLLYDGAHPAVDYSVTVEDFLQQTRIQRRGRGPDEVNCRGRRCVGTDALSGGDYEARGEMVLRVLEHGPASVDGLMKPTGLEVRELTAVLARLELAGVVQRAGPGIFVRAP